MISKALFLNTNLQNNNAIAQLEKEVIKKAIAFPSGVNIPSKNSLIFSTDLKLSEGVNISVYMEKISNIYQRSIISR